MVKPITPAIGGSLSPGPFNSLIAVGRTLFFEANDTTGGYGLWKSDGTEAGTVLLKAINLGAKSEPYSSDRAAVGSTLFFVASGGLGVGGHALWKSDGTANGTVLVKDINPSATDVRLDLLTVVGDKLFFTADDGTHGSELWQSDGSAAGTTLAKDINPGAGGAKPDGLKLTSAGLFFTADDGLTGHEPWLLAAPVASAGADQATLIDLVTLDGRASQGQGLSYRWEQTGGPAAVLSAPAAAQPTFTPVALGVYSFCLTITDTWGLTARATTTVIATAPAGALSSINGSSGAAGSAFAFTAGGFPAGAAVTISVAPPAAQAASVAGAGDAYVVGSATANAGGAVAFAVQFASLASGGAYAVTASAGGLSASALVTVSATAPLLSAPAGVPALRGLPSVFLPVIRR
jgi:ELWxxDGT repeat protein